MALMLKMVSARLARWAVLESESIIVLIQLNTLVVNHCFHLAAEAEVVALEV